MLGRLALALTLVGCAASRDPDTGSPSDTYIDLAASLPDVDQAVIDRLDWAVTPEALQQRLAAAHPGIVLRMSDREAQRRGEFSRTSVYVESHRWFASLTFEEGDVGVASLRIEGRTELSPTTSAAVVAQLERDYPVDEWQPTREREWDTPRGRLTIEIVPDGRNGRVRWFARKTLHGAMAGLDVHGGEPLGDDETPTVAFARFEKKLGPSLWEKRTWATSDEVHFVRMVVHSWRNPDRYGWWKNVDKLVRPAPAPP